MRSTMEYISSEAVVEILLERYGQTFCRELGIDIEKYTPEASSGSRRVRKPPGKKSSKRRGIDNQLS